MRDKMKKIYSGKVFKVTEQDIEDWKKKKPNVFSNSNNEQPGTLVEEDVKAFKNKRGVLTYVETGAFPNDTIEKVLDEFDEFKYLNPTIDPFVFLYAYSDKSFEYISDEEFAKIEERINKYQKNKKEERRNQKRKK